MLGLCLGVRTHKNLLPQNDKNPFGDESRGKGLAPASWSIPTQYAGLPVYVGFAGGIGPANTQDVLNQVRALMRPYWIDMETSVRTDNAFDVAKVEAVLRAAEPFVAR